MHLREGEKILKVYRHHPTPFVYKIFKLVLLFVPFYLLLILAGGNLSGRGYFWSYFLLSVLLIIVLTYSALVYWLDKLVITNQRIIYINWKYLTVKHESDLELGKIEDIQTQENGFWAHFRIFDYGTLNLATASSYTALVFTEAPDPEHIRQFINHIMQQ
ncbi:PH domain-containing protein [Candidatus Peregrinibacteria bacterium]|nr:PH domain-containing protein [Candidatus Peregrinibacteria bacterium]